MNNIKIGQFGENIAVKYLLNEGYRLISRNYRIGSGEIDIILRDPKGILTFCEVKTLNISYFSFGRGFMPEDNLSHVKLRKMKRAANSFVQKYPDLVVEEEGWRIDLVSIAIHGDQSLEIHHYQNL